MTVQNSGYPKLSLVLQQACSKDYPHNSTMTFRECNTMVGVTSCTITLLSYLGVQCVQHQWHTHKKIWLMLAQILLQSSHSAVDLGHNQMI